MTPWSRGLNGAVSADFAAGQIVTVFRSRLTPDADPAYGEHATRMGALAETMPGHVEHKTFTAEDGERVTLVTFRDQPSHDAWRVQADHVDAQRAGITSYYETYSLQVATVERVATFQRN